MSGSPETDDELWDRVAKESEAREAAADRRWERRMDRWRETQRILAMTDEQRAAEGVGLVIPPAGYAREYRRATITPAVVARAPRGFTPMSFGGLPGYRIRSRPRYWLVGLYVIHEDVDGSVDVADQATVRRITGRDVVREIQPGQHLPQTISFKGAWTFDDLVRAVELCIGLLDRVGPRTGR